MIQVRPWDKVKDYPMIEAWYLAHNSLGPHPSQLPPLGVIAFDDDGDHAAVGAYQSLGVGVAFPEWLITNPDTKPSTKVKAVVSAMECLEKMLIADGYNMFRAAVTDERIANLAKNLLGYLDIGPKVNYLVKHTPSE